MIKVIIDEDLYDHDFVDRWTYGFDELAERARELSLDEVEKMTWVPKEKIVEAARLFANSHPANVVWGLAVDMQSQGTPCAAAIAALWTITGQPRCARRHVLHRRPHGRRPALRGRVGHLRPHRRGDAEEARRLERVPDVSLRPYPGHA